MPSGTKLLTTNYYGVWEHENSYCYLTRQEQQPLPFFLGCKKYVTIFAHNNRELSLIWFNIFVKCNTYNLTKALGEMQLQVTILLFPFLHIFLLSLMILFWNIASVLLNIVLPNLNGLLPWYIIIWNAIN